MKNTKKNNFEEKYKEILEEFNKSDKYKTDVNELLLELSKIKFKSVLDLGCGTGHLMKILKKNYPSGIIKGIDKFLYGLDNHEVLDISDPNFRYNEKFDVIVMVHSINHISNLKVASTNINNLLNPNGKIIIINPGRDFMVIVKKLQDLDLKERTVGDDTVVKYLSVEEISEKFNQFNLKLIYKKTFGNLMTIKHRDENYEVYPRIIMIFEKK